MLTILVVIIPYTFALPYAYPVFNAEHVGAYELPKVDPASVQASCKDFRPACTAEAEQRYSDAIELYESRYPMCGDFGWTTQGQFDASTA